MLSSVAAKQKLFRIAEIIHLRIFGHEMGEEMRKFLGNLSWSFFGGVIATSIMFVVNIVAGRWLGPEEYGKYNAVIAALYFFMIPMGMGLDTALSYYFSKNSGEIERNNLFSSAIMNACVLLAINGVFLLVYFWLFSYRISSYTNEVVFIAFILASFFSLRNLGDALLRGLHRFREQSVVKVVEAAVLITCFLVAIFSLSGRVDYRVLVCSIIFSYIVYILVTILFLRKNIRFLMANQRKWLLIKYGAVAILGTVSGFLIFGLDKIFVQSQLGLSQLGLYSAYFTVSIGVAGQLGVIVANVLFPVMAGINEGRVVLLNKLNRSYMFLFLPVLIFFSAFSHVSFLFLGASYQYSFIVSVIFSFAATLFLYFTILWWFIASEGRSGILFTSTRGIVMGVIFLVILFYGKEFISIEFVPLSLSAALSCAIVAGNFHVYYQKMSV